MAGLWQELAAHREATRAGRILDLFDDPGRFDAFSAETEGLLLDWSKTAIDATARDLLLRLADAAGVAARREAMFKGERINESEGRAVLHWALRAGGDARAMLDGRDVAVDIRKTRAAMTAFASAIRGGDLAAADGAPFSDVVNIGIGGSDLGPRMAVAALAPYADGPRVHFVSNVDGAHVHDVLKGLEPARTLVIVASKSFTTLETMTNAHVARDWLGAQAGAQMAAVSSATARCAAFGIAPERVFGFGDYVGGRYSLWGPVGLPLMLAIGPAAFDEFLRGGAAMDRHFQSAPEGRNLPLMLALVGIWHNNICGYPSRAVIPYEQRLAALPAYLQQLDMESNGKRVTHDGAGLERDSGPVVWGAPGTDAQHAFFQLLHQGTRVVPCEFLIGAEGHEPGLAHQHALLVANCLAQSEALMRGRERPQDPARTFPGNRPSVTLAYRRLTPFVLGQIIALYEHRVFCEGAIWGINSFDQWGVELGKEMAAELLPVIESGSDAGARDGSTLALLRRLRAEK